MGMEDLSIYITYDPRWFLLDSTFKINACFVLDTNYIFLLWPL
jgi:hypothetical protein